MIPAEVPNLVAGEERPPAGGGWLQKTRPADGADLCRVARSGSADADAAVTAAREAQAVWGARTAVERGDVVRAIAELLRERREEASEIVAAETGKAIDLARGETDAAVEMGFFVAGEGRRSYGRTTTASMPHRTVLTVRRPVGVAALLISFNTPLPNVAWKALPSIFCGNASVLKPSEHAPVSAWWLGRLCLEAGLPAGVLNVVQGLGPEAGTPLVQDPRVDLVSFTGSAATGRVIAEAAGRRLAKTVMELGGKNALVVCDDADLDRAVEWTVASAFSNAGQRCAAASRIVVFDAVYDEFRERLARATWALGDIGPVISEAAMDRILAAVESACAGGATVLAGGERVGDRGWHVAPTVVEGVAADAPSPATSSSGRSRPSTASPASTRPSHSPTTRRTASRRRSTPRASIARCSSPSVSPPASSSSTQGRTAASRTWASAASSSPGPVGRKPASRHSMSTPRRST